MKMRHKLQVLHRVSVVSAVAAVWGFALASQAQVINNPVQPSAIVPNQQAVEVGPVLDVIPVVLSDGYTVNLTLIPSLTEFAGFFPEAAALHRAMQQSDFISPIAKAPPAPNGIQSAEARLIEFEQRCGLREKTRHMLVRSIAAEISGID